MAMFTMVGGFVLLLALAVMCAWVWALVDIVRRPDLEFAAAGQNKIVWVLVVVLLHVVGLVLYLVIARPALERAAAPRY
jgi:hypothetical protein